ncbi:hypothetical protein ACHAW5_004491 [Stephanodiscus triporus]|uniref:Uncharacterized protein n=1 Tax=Stephanodiscus triporus TaxID=2934178 RepID=A0ABD3Q810_9STRA
MQRLDTQMVELQWGSEARCCLLFSTSMPFSKPVKTYHYRRHAYQALLKLLEQKAHNASNPYRDALRCGIPTTCLLTAAQCRDGIEACKRRLRSLKGHSMGLWKVHLRDSYIRAKASGDEDKCKDILRIISREEQKSMWRRINRALDKPSLGTIPFVQRVEDGQVINITAINEMNWEIQTVTEKRFDLSMSAPITMSSLCRRLGFLSDTEFATNLLSSDVHIPGDVDDVTTAEKSLGVWSAIDGNDSKHIKENVTGKAAGWINKMRNTHLPARMGWIAYRFKLWASICYGIATLALPMTEARKVLNIENFQCLPFLGINRNVKREWRTLHRAFGGIGLFSFSVEHTIGMINMLLQHYGAETTLAQKMTASMEALQLEIGCISSPFGENFDELHLLATACWIKSLSLLQVPLRLFREAGYKGHLLQDLNRCRLYLKLLFLSDIATACGWFINVSLILRPIQPDKSVSSAWQLWLEFWTSFLGPGWSLQTPLGPWEHPAHRCWDWFYEARDDLLIRPSEEGGAEAYSIPGKGHRLRSRQEYQRSHKLDSIPEHCLTANVLSLPGGKVLRREIGPPLAVPKPVTRSFWAHLRLLWGEWMWEHICEGEGEVDWVRDALINGTLLAVTDGSYDRAHGRFSWFNDCRSKKEVAVSNIIVKLQ